MALAIWYLSHKRNETLCALSKPSALLPHRPESRHAIAMPDRAFPAVEALIRRVQRVAASRPDPMHILAQTISMTGAIGADPYAVLGVLVEGAVQTIVQQIPAEQQPAEQQMETAVTSSPPPFRGNV
jgi:hypothetical protein